MSLINKLFNKLSTQKSSAAEVEEKVRTSKKLLALYISQLRNQIIVAPYHKNNPGIYYEQDSCTSLNYDSDPLVIGEEVVKNFHLFSFKDRDLRDGKSTDWPAYKLSKMRSVTSFKKEYLRVSVAGANESNISLEIKAQLTSDKELEIGSVISTTANKKAIGELILKIYKKAIEG
ncbi:MAG TPA: hypothetical protein VHB54_01120 [Mucilaginibacter sp.]|nr:hypothetical protein [Mucilaginibacter sp.]